MPRRLPETPLGRFRDEWNPRWHRHKRDSSSSDEFIADMWREDEKYTRHHSGSLREDEIAPIPDVKKDLIAVRNTIRELRLVDTYAEDPEQQALLKEKKERALAMIDQLLEKVKNYMERIHDTEVLSRQRTGGEIEREPFQEAMEKADRARTLAHNALIASLQSTIRYISGNFSRISQDAQEQWEDEQEDAGHSVLHVYRTDFPKQILVPEDVDLHNRHHIADWARQLYRALSS